MLDANRGADEAVQGSLSALINDNADSAQVSSLLAGIASNTSGSLVMTLDGADQFVFYTPIDAKSGWSLVTILPLSVVESDGTQIVGITNQMVAVLAVAAPLATAESEPATRAGPTGTPWRTSTSSWRRTTP